MSRVHRDKSHMRKKIKTTALVKTVLYFIVLTCSFLVSHTTILEAKNSKATIHYIASNNQQGQSIRNKNLEVILLQKLKDQIEIDKAYVKDSALWLATETDRLKLGYAIVENIGELHFSADHISTQIDTEVLRVSKSCSKYAVDRLKPFFTDDLYEIHSRNMYCTLGQTNVQLMYWHIQTKKYYIRLHLVKNADEELINISNVVKTALENDFGLDRLDVLRLVPNDFLDGRANFAAQVDYYDKGIVGLNFIRDDKAKYFARWPVRKYHLLKDTVKILEQNHDHITLQFSYRYFVSRPGKTAKGVATIQLRLAEKQGEFLVFSVKERVFSDKK